jgi:cation-transporting P-type ATPase E
VSGVEGAPRGLTEAEVADRLARGERNMAPPAAARRVRDIVRDNVLTVFNVTLFGTLAGTLALGLGTPAGRRIVLGDTVFAGGSVVLNVLVGIVQELRAKRALDRIAALSVRRVRVRRDGALVEVDADAIVRDDLVVLAPGDRVPVDGPLVEGRGLEVDESLLTGESDSVPKAPADPLWSGSFCVAGSGLMRAADVGAASYAHRLTRTARAARNPLTPLERNINFVIQCLVALMLVVAALQMVAARNTGVSAVDALRFTLVIVTSFVPAGLVLAITVSLTAAAVRVGRHGTLVQRLSAVESMGNLTVLCIDKTGTLTLNHLVVERVEPLGDRDAREVDALLAAFAAAAPAPNRTLQAIRTRVGAPAVAPRLLAEVPFSSARKWSALSLTVGDGAPRTLVLGAPDTLLAADPATHADLLTRVDALARQGARVVILAAAPEGLAAATPGAEGIGGGLVPLALVIIHDEIRPDIAATIGALTAAGVEVRVISGDHPETVREVAARAGIPTAPLLTETELAALAGAAFEQAVRTTVLFARTTPPTKRRIVAALTRQGQYVAMVGDGINDVPALKEARLAVAMNDGAQIAKDVSDLVLLDNTLSTLPRALDEGRAITQKIYTSARLYLTRNTMTVLAIVLAGFAGLPFPAEPRLISWNATVGVVVPCAFLAFDVIRPAYTRNFARGVLAYSVLAGAIGGVVVVAATIVAYAVETGLAHTRTVFALTNLHFALHVFLDAHGVSVLGPASMRLRPGVTALGAGLLAVGVSLPQFLPGLFSATPLSVVGWGLVLGLPVIGRMLLRLYGPFVRGMARALGLR